MSNAGVMFVVLLQLASVKASSAVLDGISTFNHAMQGIQGEPLTSVDGVQSFIGVGGLTDNCGNDTDWLDGVQLFTNITPVASTFDNYTNVYTNTDSLSNGLDVFSTVYYIDGVRSDLWAGLSVTAVATVEVGMFLLLTNRHFSQLVCTILSISFWLSLGWVAVVLSSEVAAGLAVVAIVVRGSLLLFPEPPGPRDTVQELARWVARVNNIPDEYVDLDKLSEFGYPQVIQAFLTSTRATVRELFWEVFTFPADLEDADKDGIKAELKATLERYDEDVKAAAVAPAVEDTLERVTWAKSDKLPPPSDGAYHPDTIKYVDKSELITELLMSDIVCVFVTAPRRMGKSVMLSMAHRLALGQWDAFPPGAPQWCKDTSDVAVIHLNFSHFSPHPDDVTESFAGFNNYLISQAQTQHSIELSPGVHPLVSWLEQLAMRQQRVVLLVDEYDSFVNDAALSDKIGYAQDLCQHLLKPFFKATKDVDGGTLPQGALLVSVIVCGVSGVSLKSIASGANHFRHAMEAKPEWSALVGFTEQELRDTYGDCLVSALSSLPEASAEASEDDAVQFIRDIGNGWCLDDNASIELFSPYVVTSWLADPKGTDEAAKWTETGTPQALVRLLKTRAPELLEDWVVTTSDLRRGREVEDYYSAKNIAQLAFHYGYMSIRARSRSGTTVVLTVPNDAVRADIERAVVECATVSATIANELAAALRAFDVRAFENGLSKLVLAFYEAHGRPFANESELHSWGALWVTSVQRVTSSSVWTVPEVLVALDADVALRAGRATPRIDSTFYWRDADGKLCCFVIEWGIGKDELQKKRKDTKRVDSLAETKLKQLEDRSYVDRAMKWMAKQGFEGLEKGVNVMAAAAVYCWNKYVTHGEEKVQHQCKVVKMPIQEPP